MSVVSVIFQKEIEGEDVERDNPLFEDYSPKIREYPILLDVGLEPPLKPSYTERHLLLRGVLQTL